jgi:hypothetical protein
MPIASAEELLWRELDAVARTLEPGLRKAFLEAVAKLRASVSDAELLRVVETGDPRVLLDRLDLGPFKHALRQAVLDAAGSAVPNLPMSVHLDVFNTLVARAMQASEFATLLRVTTEVREGVRQAITAGLANGVHPVDTARALRTVIGLTPKQVQAVANYRQLLTGGAKGQPYQEALRRATRDARFDRTVQRAIDDRVPLTPTQVATQVQRFEERLLKQHAETLARTESISALWRAQHLAWRQAIDEGKVQEGELRRFWHVAHDERVCTVCKPIPELNPAGVEFEQPFRTEADPVMGPAVHPNCRCVVFVKPVG